MLQKKEKKLSHREERYPWIPAGADGSHTQPCAEAPSRSPAQLTAALCAGPGPRAEKPIAKVLLTAQTPTLFQHDRRSSVRMKSRRTLEGRTGRDAPGVGRGCNVHISLRQPRPLPTQPEGRRSAIGFNGPLSGGLKSRRAKRAATNPPCRTAAAAPPAPSARQVGARRERREAARECSSWQGAGSGCVRRPRRLRDPRRRAHAARPEASPGHPEERRTGRAARRALRSADARSRTAPVPRCARPPGPRGRAAAPSRPRTGPGPAGAALRLEARSKLRSGPRSPSTAAASPPRRASSRGPARPGPVPPPARRRKCKSAAAPQRPTPLKSFGGGAGPGAEGGGRERGGPGRAPCSRHSAALHGAERHCMERHSTARLTSFWRGSCG